MSKVARLVGKTAVVTGSTEGIGRAIAERLGLEGAKVIVSSRKDDHVAAVVRDMRARGLEAHGVACHVGRAEDRQRLLDAALEVGKGTVDILVSNVGVSPHFGDVLSTSDDAFDKIMEINVKAPFQLTKLFASAMKRGASILYVSSIGGYVPFDLIAAYSISKTALLGMTKVMANALGKEGIRVNCLAPGVIQTRFSRLLWESDAAREALRDSVPLGRVGTPEDCAGAAAFAVSDDAAYMTGETIVVAGGMASRL